MLLISDLDSPKLFHRKALNSIQEMEISFVKGRLQGKSADHQSLLPWAQKDAQREWMKLSFWSRGAIMWTKLRNSEEVLNWLISIKWITDHWEWLAAV